MIHSVGCPQPKASVFIEGWNRIGSDVCAHGLIDGNTGRVYQTLPWNHRGWHAGGTANNTHIGIEICEPSTIKYVGGSLWVETGDGTNTRDTVMRTYKSAVELFASLCKEYNLNPLDNGVIISHSEGYRSGVASNHGDVEHIWKKFGLTMDRFRHDIANKMNRSFLIKVSITNLNMRTGPNVAYNRIGYIPTGVYTIVETNGEWGRLKSKQKYNNRYVDAWIHMDYVSRV